MQELLIYYVQILRIASSMLLFWQTFVAFAELQTDMVHVTSDICAGGGGIPFRNYSSFCVRVMFPEDQGSDHPIMRPFDVSLKFW